MFSCEFFEISKNTFSDKTPPLAAPKIKWLLADKFIKLLTDYFFIEFCSFFVSIWMDMGIVFFYLYNSIFLKHINAIRHTGKPGRGTLVGPYKNGKTETLAGPYENRKTGTLQKPGNRDPSGTLQKPDNWEHFF